MTLRGINYGGGTQSTALIVLAAQGRLDELMGGPVVDAVFANVGDDSEDPKALAYVRDVVTPWAAERGVTVHETSRTYADGRPYQTLYQFLVDPDRKGCPIPVRLSGGHPAGRSCTAEWKAKTVQRWWTNQGASSSNPVLKAIGFSIDEMERATNRRSTPDERLAYPLLDLRMSRNDCETVITKAGLPLPPVKSACWFCPWKTRKTWQDMKRDDPDTFQRVVDLERTISEKSVRLGHGPVFMTDDDLIPIDRAVGAGVVQGSLFEGPEHCGGGSCWT